MPLQRQPTDHSDALGNNRYANGENLNVRTRSAERGRSGHRRMSHAYEGELHSLTTPAPEILTKDADATLEELDNMMLHAPSPPTVRVSSLGYLDHGDYDESEHHQSRSRRNGHRRSRYRSWEEEEPDPKVLRPGDALTVTETHEPSQGDDYDWYDDEGMRVHVREISR